MIFQLNDVVKKYVVRDSKANFYCSVNQHLSSTNYYENVLWATPPFVKHSFVIFRWFHLFFFFLSFVLPFMAYLENTGFAAFVLCIRMFYAPLRLRSSGETSTKALCRCRWEITCYQQINILCLFTVVARVKSKAPAFDMGVLVMCACVVSVSWMFFSPCAFCRAHIHSQKTFIINGIS